MNTITQIKLGLVAGAIFGALVAAMPAAAVTVEELKALRAEKRAACLEDAECAAKMEEKAQARRAREAEKLRREIAAMRG